MLTGVVNLDTASVAGDLSLYGDVSNNQVEVHGTASPGQFVVTGNGGTLLRLDGGLQTFTSLTVNGITNNIYVALDHGQDTFELGNDTDPTVVGSDVTIVNEDDDTNILTRVDIGGNLSVSRDDIAYSELEINTSIIRGDVDIDNDGSSDMGGGDTKTSIVDSEIEGTLTIENGDGGDVNLIQSTTIGAAYFVRPGGPGSPTQPVVSIDNGDGGSLTSFTLKNDPDSTGQLPTGTLGRPTVFGGIDIVNGDTIPTGLQVAPPTPGTGTPDQLKTAIDTVVFNQADVLGDLDMMNFDGHTETIIVDSKIGTDTKSIADGGYGEAIVLENGNGFDVFRMDNSDAPYGISINNTGLVSPPGGQTWGSQSDIGDSRIGGRPSAKVAGALLFFGDDGDDVFNVVDTGRGTEVNGLMSLQLYDGDDSVMIMGLPGTVRIDSLVISGSAGDDDVFLENTEVDSMIMIELDDGVDTLEIRGGVTLPGSLVGTVLLDGGIGADFYHIPSGIPWMNFDIAIP